MRHLSSQYNRGSQGQSSARSWIFGVHMTMFEIGHNKGVKCHSEKIKKYAKPGSFFVEYLEFLVIFLET